jgi:hypothetical protein
MLQRVALEAQRAVEPLAKPLRAAKPSLLAQPAAAISVQLASWRACSEGF